MRLNRPEELASRAVNQYRRREVFAYLGLRYYFQNSAARRNRWADEVASYLLERDTATPVYLELLHFKDRDTEGVIKHRILHLPGPNTAFAETLLLSECASRKSAFDVAETVFSYRLTRRGRAGVFEPYFEGYKERQNAIADACAKNPSATVLYTDIQKFYPSIPRDKCESAWDSAASESGLSDRFHLLGRRILESHCSLAQGSNSLALLTGPMFSHLIANLVFRHIDSQMGRLVPNGYFRYVDDIVFVGKHDQVLEARATLVKLLQSLDLQLHDKGKDFTVSAQSWLDGVQSFEEGSDGPSWKTLIGGLKQMLVTKPEKRTEVATLFKENQIRLPVPDYSEAVWEVSYLERLLNRTFANWFKKKAALASPEAALTSSLELRKRYTNALPLTVEQCRGAEGYERRRLLPKLRYFAGRLFYLAHPNDFENLATLLSAIPELVYHAEIFRALHSRDVTSLLPLGTNAVQTAAQPLRMTGKEVVCSLVEWDRAAVQGLATLALYGIKVSGPSAPPDSELVALAKWEAGSESLFKSTDPFIREVACLHGMDDGNRHEKFLETAFDTDDEIQLDAINQLEAAPFY